MGGRAHRRARSATSRRSATLAVVRLARADPPGAAADPAHAHGEGGRGRAGWRRSLAGDARPPIVVHTFHGHVLRGYFDPLRSLGFRLLERWLARATTRSIAVSPEVRDDLVALGVAPREKFAVVRLGIELEERVDGPNGGRAETRGAARDRARSGSPSAGSGA